MEEMSQTEKNRIYREMTHISTSLSRVLYILEDDDRTKQMGLVGSVKKNKEDLSNLRKENAEIRKELDTIYVKVGVWGGVGAFFVGVVAWIVNLIVINLFNR